MELSPLYKQRLENDYQRGFKQGKRLIIESIFRFRFGELDEELSAVIEALLDIPVEEVPPFLVDFSREELITRFRN